jgi:hypothetical protein
MIKPIYFYFDTFSLILLNMRKYLNIVLLAGFCFGEEKTISDGPYIFIDKN